MYVLFLAIGGKKGGLMFGSNGKELAASFFSSYTQVSFLMTYVILLDVPVALILNWVNLAEVIP